MDDFLLSTILSGIIWDLIKQGLEDVSAVLFDRLAYASDPKTCEEIVHKSKVHYSDNYSFEEYNTELQNDKEYMDLISSRVKYKTEFAKRLDYYITLTNIYSQQQKKINIEKVAECIGLQSVYELRKYYIEEHDPTFQFMEEVADKLGINKEWLKNGSGTMFIPKYESDYAMDCYSVVKKDNPKKIFFCLSDESHLGIICQIDEIKYCYCNHTWHFNRVVGGGGKRRIVSIHHFIKQLNEDKMLNKCEVLFIPQKYFEDIFGGSIPPSALHLVGKRKYSSWNWLEDFLSLNPTTEYGDSFKFCQEVVKEYE